MSQAKVDAYKKHKKNRKKEAAHEKHMAWLRGSIVILILALFAAWGGYSAYVNHQENLPHKQATVDYSSVTDYMSHMHDDEQSSDKADDSQTDSDAAADSKK